jgi:hypothetical protein
MYYTTIIVIYELYIFSLEIKFIFIKFNTNTVLIIINLYNSFRFLFKFF